MTTSGRKTDIAGLSAKQKDSYTTDEDLDLMIAYGYGNKDRDKIPANWRDLPPLKTPDGKRWPKTPGRPLGSAESRESALFRKAGTETHAEEMRRKAKVQGRRKKIGV